MFSFYYCTAQVKQFHGGKILSQLTVLGFPYECIQNKNPTNEVYCPPPIILIAVCGSIQLSFCYYDTHNNSLAFFLLYCGTISHQKDGC